MTFSYPESADTRPRPPALVDILRAQLLRNPPPPAWLKGRVVFDPAGGDTCTLVVGDGIARALPGTVGKPDTRLSGEASLLGEILKGNAAGVEAFLSGGLRVEGNLGLSLQLDALLDHGKRPDRFPRPSMRRAGKVRTAYLEAGPPGAPVVVAIHGLGATNASLLPTIWDLAADFRVIAPDLPGHGASAAPRAGYDAAFFSRWLEAFLDEVGVERAALVGNSLGGRIALEFGLDAPQRVAGLVLLAPAVAFRKLRQMVPLVRFLRPELAALPLPMTQRAAVVGLHAIFARPARLTSQSYDAAAGEFVRVFRDRAHRVAFFCALRSIYLDDAFGEQGFWRRLPALAPPSLFIWGRRDRLVPIGFARHVAQAVPQAETVIFDDCGHVPQYELPERTNSLVRQFLAGRDW